MPKDSRTHQLILLMLLGGFLALLIYYGETLPPPWPDETLFIQPAQHLAEQGTLATPSLTGQLLGIEKYTFWQPPLYFLTLSGWGRVFGFSLLSARWMSRALGVFALILAYFLSIKWNPNKKFALAVLFITSMDSLFQFNANLSRMEALTTCFTLLSLSFFIAHWQKANPGSLFLSGLFGALAALSHLIALPLVFGMALLLWEKRQWKESLLFLSPILLGLALWIGLYGAQDISAFIHQNTLQILRKSQMTYKLYVWLFGKFFPLVGFPTNTFPIHIPWIVLLLLHISPRSAFRFSGPHFLLVTAYLSTLIGGEPWYLGWYAPFNAFLIVQAIQESSPIAKKVPFLIFSGWIAFQLLLLIQNALFVPTLKEEITRFVAENVNELPPNATVTIYSVPDLSLYLEKARPDLIVHQVAPVPLPDEVFEALKQASQCLIIMPAYADLRLRPSRFERRWFFHGPKGEWFVARTCH